MWDALLWVYVANATLLINHEIDSAFWREWTLFRIPGGIALFLIIHLPLVGAVLSGLVLVANRAVAGLYFSLGLGLGGLAAFAIHVVFLKKGHPEFRTPVSISILAATLVASIIQVWLVVRALAGTT